MQAAPRARGLGRGAPAGSPGRAWHLEMHAAVPRAWLCREVGSSLGWVSSAESDVGVQARGP